MMYTPMLPIYIYGVLRTQKLLYFTATNPGIEMGGFFGEKKDEILDLIDPKYKVKSLFVSKENTDIIDQAFLTKNNVNFPLIAKPNVGERGYGVKKILSLEELEEYASDSEDFIIQEYVDFSLELGVLYQRLPEDRRGRVSSITSKRFLSVTGDGRCTVKQLLLADERGKLYLDLFEKDYPERMGYIPDEGERYQIHSIGNHSKGTRFLDSNAEISERLNLTFDRICSSVEGVFYGRYDLKVPSFQDLESGENIKIFELNGVSSEPGHIYDQKNVFKAYSSLAKHWLDIIHISRQNIKKGVKPTPLSYFLTKVKTHFTA